ncbi:MAG: thiamine pyrophosphate-dependent enzyme, partial [Propylenella sp.]
MAERSFAKEVEQLKIGAGEEFRGEGILAITKALLECGVAYVGGYQGAPISHLMDVLSDAQDILGDLGVHFESSASEAAAAAMLAASIHYPIRGAVTFKSTVGTNVASDALANLASGGVKGGALIVVGEDYGEGSSIMQERSHSFAMKSQIWLLDPRPNLETIVQSVRDGFELSEISNTPVMLEVRIRACHVHGRFRTRDNQRPKMSLAEALENPRRDLNRIVLPPASYLHEKEKIEHRWPAAVKFIRERGLNERFTPEGGGRVGIVMQGGMYNGVMRALQRLGLADIRGRTDVPLYVLNVTYPLIDEEFLDFARDKDAVLVVEEGQPNHIEQAFGAMLHRAGIETKLFGKDPFPIAGEYTGAVMLDSIRKFLRADDPDLLSDRDRAPNAPPQATLPDLSKSVPPRPPSFCTGCPERPIFAAMKLVENELGPHHVAADIGCHLFSIMPPFNIGASTMGYGLGPASASAFNVPAKKRAISIMGDGGFWHNG